MSLAQTEKRFSWRLVTTVLERDCFFLASNSTLLRILSQRRVMYWASLTSDLTPKTLAMLSLKGKDNWGLRLEGSLLVALGAEEPGKDAPD